MDAKRQSRSACDGDNRGAVSWRDNFDEEMHGNVHFASMSDLRGRLVANSRAMSGSAFDWDSTRSAAT